MSEINDAAVEAAARVLFASAAHYPVRAWDEGRHPYDEDEREEFRALARAALTAALPHLTPEPRGASVEEVGLAVSDPGSILSRDPSESVSRWSARALLARFNISPKETDRD